MTTTMPQFTKPIDKKLFFVLMQYYLKIRGFAIIFRICQSLYPQNRVYGSISRKLILAKSFNFEFVKVYFPKTLREPYKTNIFLRICVADANMYFSASLLSAHKKFVGHILMKDDQTRKMDTIS